ncbi:MAG: carbonic anhydrase family protein [Gammaproteobacteria bacterium]
MTPTASTNSFCAVLLMALLAHSVHAEQSDVPHWTYADEGGPGVWATLSPEYAECMRGKRQSPIDLPVVAGPELPVDAPAALAAFHHEHVLEVRNDGHTIEVEYDDGDDLVLDDKTYRLVQYHFHAPSEHTVAGQHFPLELHLVHRAADGELAVIGVLLEQGQHNPVYDPVLGHIPAAAGVSVRVEHVSIDVDELLPASRNAFGYLGSLTTPPCSEGVHWLVLRAPVALDAAQIGSLAGVLHGNSRPVQPLHGRLIEATTVEDAPTVAAH